MTTKFSQRNGTQTLPPVCRATVVLMPSWLPPAYPTIFGLCEFEMKRDDGIIDRFKVKLTLPWIPEENYWYQELKGTKSRWWHEAWHHKYILTAVIGPPATPPPLRIQIAHYVPDAPELYTDWYGPSYVPGQPWQSGTHSFSYPGPHAYSFQTFHT